MADIIRWALSPPIAEPRFQEPQARDCLGQSGEAEKPASAPKSKAKTATDKAAKKPAAAPKPAKPARKRA